MLHFVGKLLVAAVAIGTLGWSAAAMAADIDPSGKPEKFEAGKLASYYVWRDRGGWHLRTTTQAKKRRFHGVVRVVGGEVSAVNTDGLEKKGDKADFWKLSDDRKEITFDLQTETAIDGFDFRLGGAPTRVEFSLKIDDEDIKTNRINIGSASNHPESVDFSLPTRRQ
jgi:hypothetical protein